MKAYSNESKQALGRLKRILMTDKVQSYDGFFRVLKGDICTLLSSYLTFDNDGVRIQCDVDNDGNYQFRIALTATNIKSPKTLAP